MADKKPDCCRRATGLRRRVWLAAFAGVLAATGSIAAPLEPVPLPRPRPAETATKPLPAAAAPSAAIRQTAQPPISQNSRFSPQQQTALFHINNYFNSFQTMQGQFIQFGPHGEQSEGSFFMARPGKIRFQYKPPVRLDVISDGKNVAILDNRTKTQDYYPLGKTPLRYLLSRSIDLTSDRLINDVREDPDLIAVTIVENSTFVKGKLTLIFDRRTYELKQWIVTDAQGLNTSVAIYNVATGKPADPGKFVINYYLGSPNNPN